MYKARIPVQKETKPAAQDERPCLNTIFELTPKLKDAFIKTAKENIPNIEITARRYDRNKSYLITAYCEDPVGYYTLGMIAGAILEFKKQLANAGNQ